jgi:hypothetical protein
VLDVALEFVVAGVVVAGEVDAVVVTAPPVVVAEEAGASELEPLLDVVAEALVPGGAVAAAAAAIWEASASAKLVGSGAWMLPSARAGSPPGDAPTNAIVVGAGITIPIPAAIRSIRWLSLSVATVA